MNIPTKFKEYIWLVNTIHQTGRITFADINKQWIKIHYLHRKSNVELNRR